MMLMVFFSSRISPLASAVIFLRQVAVGNRCGDSAMLRTCPVRLLAIEVDAVGQILPRARDAFDIGLPAEFAVRSHFAGDTRDFRGEGVQLIHHDVDGVLRVRGFRLWHRP